MSNGVNKNPGLGLDTGTGGFPDESSGDRLTYDVGLPDVDPATGKPYPRPKWSAGQISVDNNRQDLSKPTRQTLASYLSKTTLGQTESASSQIANKYPVRHDDGTDPVELSLQDEKGYPHPITSINASQPSQPHYFDTTPGDSRSPVSKDLKILRGRQEPSSGITVDGNSLLSKSTMPALGAKSPPDPMKNGVGGVNVTRLDAASPVAPYSKAAIDENTYDNDTQFVQPDASPAQSLPLTLEPGISRPIIADLPTSNKNTLNAYLRVNTLGNKYPIGGATIDVSLYNDPSRPTSLTGTDQKHFIDSKPGNDLVSPRPNEPARAEIDPVTTDGHTLLSDPNGPGLLYSKSVLVNRFTPDTQFEDFLDDNQLGGKLFSSKYSLGVSPSPVDARSFSFGRLAQIGPSLSIRAGLELNSTSDGNNPSSGGTEAAAILPGIAQLGLKRINRDTLTAKDVIESITSSGIGENQLINPAADSWGTLNNVLDQFSGISNFGMQLLSVALFVALALVITVIAGIFALFGGVSSQTVNKDGLGRRVYGANEADKNSGDFSSPIGIVKAIIAGKFNFWRMIGVGPTKHDLLKALPTGALSFFGSYDNKSVGLGEFALEAAKSAANAAQNPGYYSVMARSVNRSFLQIADAFSAMGNAFKAGFVAFAKALLNIIDVLRASKFIQAINVFSRLGDQILSKWNDRDDEYKTDKESFGYSIRFKSDIDNNENVDAASKGRLKVVKGNGISPLTLSWAAYRAPDMFVMPGIMQTISSPNSYKLLGIPTLLSTVASDGAGGKNGGLPNNDVYQQTDATNPRIPTEVREKFEDSLESEYVPFYFHDVRTNEIVSFHAFLASLSDDYTASYESSETFGRVEPIKIYKGTQRRIGFSFYVVATNDKDFDSMWLKINKLTTLVYPQFTEGRMLLDSQNSYKLHAPFSQTIQASPMIRVRIGDLIKTNYSKFNLARLFGYTYPDTQFGASGAYPTSVSGDVAKRKEAYEKIAIAKGNTFRSNATLSVQHVEPAGPISLGGPEPKTDANITLPNGFVLKIDKILDGNKVVCEVIEADTEDQKGRPEPILNDLKKYKGGSGSLGANYNIFQKKYVLQKSDLIPTATTIKKVEKDFVKPDPYTDGAQTFLEEKNDSSGNAISRSFRTVGGKGIAGFIESMGFDWYDRVTWEVGHGVDLPAAEFGRRAPKMCKVTIAFSPIHDITPGLDSLGANRAPVYPVGPLAAYDMKSKQ